MKAVIYARYSSHGQTEQSIEGQLRDCYAYAQSHDLTIVGEYIDRAISGRTDERPDFQRMITDAAKRSFACVLVWKLDRFARNRYDSAFYKAQLKKNGVRVISATESISDEPEGIILEGLLESMAEYYSANLAKHVRRGQRESILAGKFLGGTLPIGFLVEDQHLVIDERTAPIVQEIFRMADEGITNRDIIADLTARGLMNRSGKPFTQNAILRVLRNKKYIGTLEYSGEEYEGWCPAIVDPKVFERVGKRLDQRRYAPAAGKGGVTYSLQGKAFCGHCGAALVGDSGTGHMGELYRYYSCGARKKRGSCKKSAEKKDFLEKLVVEQTLLYVLDEERLRKIAVSVAALNTSENSNAAQIDRMKKQLTRIDQEIGNLVDSLTVCPASARDPIFAKIDVLSTQKFQIDLDLSRLQLVDDERSANEIFAWLKEFCQGDPNDEAYRQRIIDTFVNAVYVFDDRLLIYYNTKDGQQRTAYDPEHLTGGEEISLGSDLTPLDKFGFDTACTAKLSQIRTFTDVFVFIWVR